MVTRIACALALLLATAASARAQSNDIGATLAAAEEEIGQSVGQAAFAGPSVFVTATGRARLPAPLADAYYVSVKGESASAVQAVHERDQRIASILADARRLGIDAEIGDTNIALGVDPDEQNRLMDARTQRMQAALREHPGVPLSEPIIQPAKLFMATTSLRFRSASSTSLATFMDVLHQAGVDEITRGSNLPSVPFIPQRSELMGFGSVATLDPAIWKAASEDAMRSAREQAQSLAQAAGRTLGSVRNVMVMTRSIEGGEVVEGLAVRFAFADAPH